MDTAEQSALRLRAQQQPSNALVVTDQRPPNGTPPPVSLGLVKVPNMSTNTVSSGYLQYLYLCCLPLALTISLEVPDTDIMQKIVRIIIQWTKKRIRQMELWAKGILNLLQQISLVICWVHWLLKALQALVSQNWMWHLWLKMSQAQQMLLLLFLLRNRQILFRY